jgi:transcriptional regulator with XRE-family HTH domain
MFSKEKFSERIKQLRVEKKIKQTDIADFLGVTPTQISDLENGKTTTSIERLCLLADYFNVSTDYLVGHNQGKDGSYI